MSGLRCFPQSSHPNAPLSPTMLGKRFGVTPEQVQIWISQGLPLLCNNLIDPFICCNWLSWGPLDTVPALKRLWRQFMAQFRPFVEGRDLGRALEWQRDLVLYLPDTVASCRWMIPKMQADFSWQSHALLQDLHSVEGRISNESTYWQLASQAPRPQAQVRYALEIKPQQGLNPSDPEFKVLLSIAQDIVATFDYHYRVHELDDVPRLDLRQGTCLDIALYTARILEEHGRSWRLCGGVIAHSALLNAHHWLEVETTSGWVPFDLSIPAIARMLGEEWEYWTRRYCGGLDSGRIALTRGPGYWDVPERNFISAATGAAVVQLNGQELNAWPCIDWVCGECDGAISQQH